MPGQLITQLVMIAVEDAQEISRLEKLSDMPKDRLATSSDTFKARFK